jgi:hypothetical protein
MRPAEPSASGAAHWFSPSRSGWQRDERDERLSWKATDQVLKGKPSEDLRQNRAQAEAAEARVGPLEQKLKIING